MVSNRISNRSISILYTLIILVSLAFTLPAQNKSGDEKVMIGGKKYTLYTAVSGDSPFSISRKFGLTLDDLKNANPEIMDKLNSGQIVKIPETKSQTTNGLLKEDSEDRLFIYHSVRKKETVFSIAQKNNTTSEDIYQHNPQARDGIKEGDILKIPKTTVPSNEPKTVTIKVQQPIKHVVGRRETLFSIAKQYNTTQEAILKLNPSLTGSLSKGTVLMIPSAIVLSPDQEKQVSNPKFTEYRIVNGDNYFQLEKRFGISKADLQQLNPALKEGFNVGMTIKIPLKKVDEDQAISEAETNNNLKNASSVSHADPNKTYEVGVFLPFCQNLNDSSKIVQRTSVFLEFYSGVLLATEKMTQSGMKVKLHVYDTFQDNNVIEKLVKNPEFLSLDLIIGPVYPDNQKVVAGLSAKNRIPMISPLSSDSRFVSTTQGYYQINPGKKLRLAGTADYIADKFSGQNIIFLNNGSNWGDEKLILDRLNQKLGVGKVRIYNIWAEGTSGLEAMLKPEKENIIVLSDGQEANVSVAMTRLNTISKSNKITVIGLQEYTKMQSIDIEHLHNTRLQYLAPYFIDYVNPQVIAFVEKYRSSFSSEPTQYSFQGYDVTLHFLASLGKAGKNFPVTNPNPGVELLQTDYSFQKVSNFGGYMNQTLHIIEYTDSFEVKSIGKIRGAILSDNGDGNGKNGL